MSAADRMERIFEALDAVFARAGLDGMTMDAIAAEAGMSKRTLYGLFADRDELFAAYMGRIRSQFVRELDAAGRARPLEERLRLLLAPCPRARPSGLPAAVLRFAVAGAESRPEAAQACLSRCILHDRALIRDELDRAVARGEAEIADTAQAAAILEGMLRPSLADILLNPGAPPAPAETRARFETGLAMFLRAVAP